jgi:hypothetical protein
MHLIKDKIQVDALRMSSHGPCKSSVSTKSRLTQDATASLTLLIESTTERIALEAIAVKMSQIQQVMSISFYISINTLWQPIDTPVTAYFFYAQTVFILLLLLTGDACKMNFSTLNSKFMY